MMASLATIIERIDNLKETFKDHTAEDDKRFEDHERRLRSSEGLLGKATGYALGVSAIAGVSADWIAKKLGLS